MFTPRDIALLAVLPFIVAVALSLLVRWPGKANAKVARLWPAPLALAAALLAAGLGAFHVHMPPREALDWVILLPAAALVAAIGPPMVRLLLALPMGVLAAWLLPPPATPWLDRILVAIAPLVLFAATWPVARRPGHWALPLIYLALGGATVAVESASTGIDFAKYTTTLPAAAAGLLAASLVARRHSLGRDALAAFLFLWIPLLAYGHLWLDVPPWRSAVLAAAPLAALVSLLPPFKTPALRGIAALLAVVAVALVPAIPAAREVLALIRSQTEVGGY